MRAGAGHGWAHAGASTAVPPGEVRPATVAGVPLVLANAAGDLLAARAACPACGGSLAAARLEGTTLRCACGAGFDVRPGAPGPARLDEIPLMIVDDEIFVHLPPGTPR